MVKSIPWYLSNRLVPLELWCSYSFFTTTDIAKSYFWKVGIIRILRIDSYTINSRHDQTMDKEPPTVTRQHETCDKWQQQTVTLELFIVTLKSECKKYGSTLLRTMAHYTRATRNRRKHDARQSPVGGSEFRKLIKINKKYYALPRRGPGR